MKVLVWLLIRGCFCCGLFTLFFTKYCHGQTAEISLIKKELSYTKDSLKYIDLLNSLSKYYSFQALDSSLYYAMKAKTLAERKSYKKGLANAFYNYGVYYSEIPELYLAYKFMNEALDMFRSIGDKVGECRTYIYISLILGREDKAEQSLAYLDKAYEKSNSIKNDSLLSVIYTFQVNAKSFLQGNWLEQKNLVDMAISIAKKYKDWVALMNAEITLANLGFMNGMRKGKCLELLHSVDTRAQASGAVAFAGLANLGIANIYQQLQQTDSADFFYQKALALSDSGKMTAMQQSILKGALKNVTGKSGFEKELTKYTRMEMAMQERWELTSQKEGFSMLESTLKENELRVSSANDKGNKMWISFLAAASFCLLMSVFFLYRLFRQKHNFMKTQHLLIEELEMKNKVLQENNEFNKSLISIMAHDLRQPFSSIIMLDRTNAKDTMQKEHYLAMIKQMRITSEKSIQVMDGLLQWMKLQLLGIGYQPSPINLFDNINEAISFNADLIARKKIRIVNMVDCDMMVNAQQEMLLFINRNIINNAVKFSPLNGEISVMAKKTLHEIHLSVCDSGEGIPSNELANLFKNPSRNSKGAPAVLGAGIALFICKDMISKMNGKIWAENNLEGKGAIFTYSLSIPHEKTSLNTLLEINGPSSLN
ncbi:Histidine kinase-, DNA gyrase B-, and HSP90-like ATPase [bacterium A37T11]|nr:Histidine kinase-, DNA gyrase B-, and HSP90-like ATPase [bacterium A37T11]